MARRVAPVAPSAAALCRWHWVRTPTVRSGCRRRSVESSDSKPTYGRLSRARSFPFVFSLDHLGPFARNVGDLALAYDAMQGPDTDDAACTTRPAEPVTPFLAQDVGGLKIAIAGGYFQKNVFPEAIEAVARVAKALGTTRVVEIQEAARARAAAYVITTSEGASLHLDRLRKLPNDFDPAVRDRVAGGRDDPRAAGRSRTEIPPLVSCPRCCKYSNRSMSSSHRRRPASRRSLGRRHSRSTASNFRYARQYRHSYPADFLHRSSRGRSAGSARPDADRGADHRQHPGGKISRCASLMRWSALA